MQLSALDAAELFSLTLWKSESGWTVGIQKHAGDLVRYETRKTIAGAIEALLATPKLPPLPY